jgi:hypothetical protein
MRFTWNGDFLESGDGDFATSASDTLLSLIDQIQIIVGSSLNDWEIYPNKGAGTDDFIGEANTQSLGGRLTDRIRISIISAGLVKEEDLEIRVFPVSIYKLMTMISVNAMPTATNGLNAGERVLVSLVFDTVERQAFFLDQTPKLIGG